MNYFLKRITNFEELTFSSLKLRNYRLYFFGQAVSLCGSWMQTIAQDWLVLQLTKSGTQLGLVTALQFLPVLIFGPYGGVIADRFPKRRMLYLTQAAAALLALILGILVATGIVQVWMIYILATGLGLVRVVDNPTRQAFVHEMVGDEHISNAVSLNSMEVNLTRAIGPVIAGAIIASLGIAECFFINAISYIAVLISLYMMRDLLPSSGTKLMKGQLAAGLRYVRSTPTLLYTLIMISIIGTLSYEFSVVLPLFAQFTLKGDARTYAILVSAIGIGSVLGGLVTARRVKPEFKLLIQAAMLFGLTMGIAAFMPNLVSAFIALIFVGVFSINFISLANTTLQLGSAPEMRGRVMALWAVAFLGSTPIGGPIIGWIGEYLSPRWGLVVGGVAAIVAAGVGFLVSQRVTQYEETIHHVKEVIAAEVK